MYHLRVSTLVLSVQKDNIFYRIGRLFLFLGSSKEEEEDQESTFVVTLTI